MVELARCVLPFSEHPYLPLQHAAALLLVGRLSERAKGARAEEEGVPEGLYSSLKYSTKKNGVSRAAADVRGNAGGARAYACRKSTPICTSVGFPTLAFDFYCLASLTNF